MIQGSTAADTLHNLRRLYCGCKFIIRGLVIYLSKGNNQAFRVEDFNFLYYRQEINQYLFLNHINVYGRHAINFPNLRIIRGNLYFNLKNKNQIALRINVNA